MELHENLVVVVVFWFFQNEPFFRDFFTVLRLGLFNNFNWSSIVVVQLSGSVDFQSWDLWSNWGGPWSNGTFSILFSNGGWLEGL
ncbi:hypothetical protein WICPIJ_004469 [Wickerhamomyces pijperi]|uniref:Uncharacterized protein n=1 Tax=Wickerhamomyces pijperi TaxID=599730 RepID=A0A9P8Q7Z5_WICPI|nr:hypothetical protein WICPIJ_004469 [Wickerhamomyces pijperi]